MLDRIFIKSVAIRPDMWDLQDGAQCLRTEAMIRRRFSKTKDRKELTIVMATSLDLSRCDFFLWKHLKLLVYETSVNTVQANKSD